MVSISPQKQKYSRQVAAKHGLAFPVLQDPGNATAERFGLVWTMPEKMRQVYLDFGIDLPRFNGDEAWRLPMPGSFIVGGDRIIRHAEVHPDYTTRPEPEETLSILKAAL